MALTASQIAAGQYLSKDFMKRLPPKTRAFLKFSCIIEETGSSRKISRPRVTKYFEIFYLLLLLPFATKETRLLS